MFADAETEVAPPVGATLDLATVIDVGVVRRRQIRRAADQLRDHLRRPLDHVTGRLPGRDRFVVGREARQVGVPPVGKPPCVDHLERVRLSRERRPVRVEALLPLGLELASTIACEAEVGQRLVGHVEVLVGIPAVGLLGEADFVFAQR